VTDPQPNKTHFDTNQPRLLGKKWSVQEGSGVFLKFWEWLEGLGAKDRALAKCGNLLGILCEFLGYLERLGPDRKYFSEP
jgi:hypothetical protein